MESVDLGAVLNDTLKNLAEQKHGRAYTDNVHRQAEEEKSGAGPDIDLITGYPVMQLSFILSQMAPVMMIKRQAKLRRQQLHCKRIQRQFHEVKDISIDRCCAVISDAGVPKFVKRSSIKGDPLKHDEYDIDIEENEQRWKLVALKKTASYEIDDKEYTQGTIFFVEDDPNHKGFVRLHIRNPENTSDYKVNIGDKWYLSSKQLATEFKEHADNFREIYGLNDTIKNAHASDDQASKDATKADEIQGEELPKIEADPKDISEAQNAESSSQSKTVLDGANSSAVEQKMETLDVSDTVETPEPDTHDDHEVSQVATSSNVEESLTTLEATSIANDQIHGKHSSQSATDDNTISISTVMSEDRKSEVNATNTERTRTSDIETRASDIETRISDIEQNLEASDAKIEDQEQDSTSTTQTVESVIDDQISNTSEQNEEKTPSKGLNVEEGANASHLATEDIMKEGEIEDHTQNIPGITQVTERYVGAMDQMLCDSTGNQEEASSAVDSLHEEMDANSSSHVIYDANLREQHSNAETKTKEEEETQSEEKASDSTVFDVRDMVNAQRNKEIEPEPEIDPGSDKAVKPTDHGSEAKEEEEEEEEEESQSEEKASNSTVSDVQGKVKAQSNMAIEPEPEIDHGSDQAVKPMEETRSEEKASDSTVSDVQGKVNAQSDKETEPKSAINHGSDEAVKPINREEYLWDDGLDVNIAFPCTKWPRIASKWFERERSSGWPRKESVYAVHQKACIFIPSAHPNSDNKEIEWRMFFSIEKITKELNDTQKQCFILLKILRFFYLSSPDILTDFHLLYVVLWLSEKKPQIKWTRTKLGECFNDCLTELMEYCKMGEFLHYFINDLNLFEGISADHLDELVKKLSEARKQSVDIFYSFSAQYLTEYFPVTANLKEIFESFDLQSADKTRQECEEKQRLCLMNLRKRLLDDKRYLGVLAVQEDMKTLDNREIDGRDFLLIYISNTDVLDTKVEAQQFIAKHFSQARDYGNFGCYLHAQHIVFLWKCLSIATKNEQETADLKDRANDAFKTAIKLDPAANATRVDYGFMLLLMKDYEGAIEVVEKVGSTGHGGNAYDISERDTIPEELRPWVDQDRSVDAESANFAQYILVQCFLHTNQIDRATTEVRKMRQYLRSVKGKKKTSAYFLLAYSAKALKRPNLAFDTFSQLCKEVPSDLATQEKNACEEMLMATAEKDRDEISDIESEGPKETKPKETQPEESKHTETKPKETNLIELAGKQGFMVKGKGNMGIVPRKASGNKPTGRKANENRPNDDVMEMNRSMMGNSGARDTSESRKPDEDDSRNVGNQVTHIKVNMILRKFTAENAEKLKEGAFQDVLENYNKMCETENFPVSAEQYFCILGSEELRAQKLAAEHTSKLFEFMIAKFPNMSDMASAYTNMACMYHIQYEVADESMKKEFKHKAKEAFLKADKHKTKDEVSADYINFLHRTGDVEAAIAAAERCIAIEAAKPPKEWSKSNSVGYNKRDAPSVDQCFQLIIEEEECIFIPAIILAFYVLIYSCIKLGRDVEAKTTLLQMQETCAELADPSHQTRNEYLVSTYLLLGQVAKDLGETDTAMMAYYWVTVNDKKHPEGNQFAKAMVMSLQN